MTTTTTAQTRLRDAQPTADTSQRDNPINHVVAPILPQFDRMIQTYAIFNLLFLTFGFIEFTLLVIFFTFLAKSAILAFSLAIVFLTFFSYFILRLYYQTQKPGQFQDLKERYLRACKGVMNYREGVPEHHIALAGACAKFSDSLQGREYSFYRMPSWLSILDPYIEKFSYWHHWTDVQKMRELLLFSAIEENIKVVKCEPTSIEAHAGLANAYVVLSGLYVNSNKHEEDTGWLSNESLTPDLEHKFRSTAERAIEEFKILSDFAPDDPWVHAQLAYSYHDLKMPLEEIKEYEILLNLSPTDTDTMLRLGILYFQQGMNAKGLRIYEELKESAPKNALELIRFYGAYQPFKDMYFHAKN